MRHHFEKFKNNIKNRDEQAQLDQITEKIFGTESYGDTGTLPGAIAVSDARLIAFPIRSSKSPFVWITCPAVLQRLEKDLDLTGKSGEMTIPEPGSEDAFVINGNISAEEKILLEDYEVIIKKTDFELSDTSKILYQKAKILLLVSNETYHYGVSHCTEIRTQIKIDDKTGTTVDGSLRYEEVLPADSLMYVVLFYGATRDADTTIPADTLISYMKEDVIRKHIQIGGNETLGCGLFQIEWI